jgi:hypothetical protein
MWNRREVLNVIMGPHSATSRASTQPATQVKGEPEPVKLRVFAWEARLQYKSLRTTRGRDQDSRDANQKEDVGIPYKSRALLRYLLGSLSMPRDMDLWHKKHLNWPDGILQAQVPDTAICHSSRCHSDGVRGPFQVLKSLPPFKGETRTAVELPMEILKGVGTEEEIEVDTQRKKMGNTAAEQTKSQKAELEGIWTAPNEVDLADDNLWTTESVQITHSAWKGGQNIIEDKEAPIRVTRAPKQQKLLSVIGI